MNFTLLKNVFFVVLYFLLFQVIVAQEKARINKIDHKLWSQIQAQLNEDTNIKSFNFIKQLTTNYKTVKPDSLFSVYYQIMIKLESEFNIPAAIYVGEEMVSIAKKQNNLEQEANTYLNLFRYYDAMGLYNLSLNSVNKAHDIFTRLSQENNIIFSKLMLLSERSYFEDPKLILNEIKKLQKEAYKLNDERINKEILIELIGIALLAKDFTVAANNINKLESTLGAKPENNKDFTLWMLIATTRAEIALAENNISKAKKHYNEVLQLSTQKPDKWREIESLKKLAEIALLEGNIKNANTYLNKALPKAKQLNIPELLTEIYSLKAAIAEKHLKYKEANLYLKQREHYSNVFSDRSKGFNYEAYYIHKEKEKLATEKKNSELELSLQKTQIKNSFYLMALIFSIALGAIVAYFLERKRKQIAITKSNLTKFHLSQLENLDKTKSRFFANISHELRTPLSLIVAPISTMLNEKNISEKQRKIIQTVDKNAKHLVAITNNILSLKKLESGNLVLALQPTNLFTFFQIQICQFESLAKQKELDYCYQINIEKNVYAEIDVEKCRQVLYNLISNAIKYTNKKGSIVITVNVNKQNLQVKVKDSGIGIHTSEVPNIFKLFYQSKHQKTEALNRTGIGLSLCKEYAVLFNGFISVQSKLNQGSTFCFSFPIINFKNNGDYLNETVKDKASIIVEQPDNSKKVIVNSKTNKKPVVLLVEDNYDLTEYIEILLKPNYNVIAAENGQVALALLEKQQQLKIELIISDYAMPIMDGFTMLNILKANSKTANIPVIMLTALAGNKDKIKALRIGVDDFLTKPFQEEELLARINNLLINSRKREIVHQKESRKLVAKKIKFSEDKKWLEKFENYLILNLSNKDLSVPFLSEEFAMSESTLLRQLKRLTGLTPAKYLLEIRLNIALDLLQNNTYNSVAKIAAKVGFSNTRSFTRSFGKRFGKNPTDFLNR